MIWSKSCSKLDERINAVATDRAGALFVSGNLDSNNLDFGCGPLSTAGGNDAVIAKLSP